MKKNVIVICIDGMANYNFENPNLKVPVLKSLMEKGIKADGMEVAYPSVTWAMNTSIITGTFPIKHGVLGNWVVDKNEKKVKEFFGDRDFSKESSIKVPTLYDIAHQNGWTTASICWPLTKGADHIDYNIPEFYEQELFEEYCTKGLWKELSDYGLPVEKYAEWSKDHARGHMQDWLSTEVAKYLIEKHKPNLMMIHYLLADSLQHDHGIGSQEALWSMNYIDERIGDLINKLKEENIYDNTDIYVISDHGFAEVEYEIRPNVLFKQHGLYIEENSQDNKVIAVSNGASGFVSILDKENHKTLLKEVKELLAQTEGVDKIYESDEFPSLGLPKSDSHHLQADLIFESKEGYFVGFKADCNSVIGKSVMKGMHGFLPQKDKLKAMFIAHGPSIKKGETIPEISLVDVAPTIAYSMGLNIPNADGKVIESIFKKIGVKL
ncbi:putative AlkP superfamily pyrophosphatase or phosphodiesterase [Chryseomicrobium aureum]|uniref:alkaline phosphatase family protein n=1 Tax=Chryseomicrobium aureum TaxID=1441723 RepID=UPI00195DEC87|nr:alkaline phosphatase family protein [Chryseomicrobium aureum]MBM7707098.1 putative AlkP superfamily pyrophosphatase or phosphodiesterase [Chryseomicrobium aureum]